MGWVRVVFGCEGGCLGCLARLSAPVALTLPLSRRAGEGSCSPTSLRSCCLVFWASRPLRYAKGACIRPASGICKLFALADGFDVPGGVGVGEGFLEEGAYYVESCYCCWWDVAGGVGDAVFGEV